MTPILDITKIKAAVISKIWVARYRLKISNNARSRLANSKYNLRIIVHHFDRYYQDSIPEDRDIIFKVAYYYFPKRIPGWVLLARRMNLSVGDSIAD